MTTQEAIAELTTTDPDRDYTFQSYTVAQRPRHQDEPHTVREEFSVFVIPGFCNRNCSKFDGASLAEAVRNTMAALQQEAALAA